MQYQRFVGKTLKLFFVISLSFLSSTSILAQGEIKQKGSGQKQLHDGARALLFGVGSNFNLNSFEGALISYKYHLSDTRAVRFGLDLSGSFTSGDSQTTRGDDYYTQLIENEKSDAQGIGANLHYMFYSPMKNNLNFYLGAGPLGRFYRSNYESDVQETRVTSDSLIDSTRSYEFKRTDYSKEWAAGASGIIGVEWFASKSISFLAEYAVACEYRWTRTIKQNTYTFFREYDRTETKEKGIHINPVSVKFGLSVYF